MRSFALVALVAALCLSCLSVSGADVAPPSPLKVFVSTDFMNVVETLVNSLLTSTLKHLPIADATLNVAGGHVDLSSILLHGHTTHKAEDTLDGLCASAHALLLRVCAVVQTCASTPPRLV
jgi:hypothetical protein